MANIRVGIIGVGRAARYHAAAVQQTGGLELCVVAGRTRENTATFCSDTGCAARPVTIDEALYSDGIDAIILAVPGAVQPKLAIAAFEAGKHVLCEKPLAASLEEALRVEDAWASSGRVGMVNFCYRLIPEIGEFGRLLKSGVCGEINLVQVDWVLASRANPHLAPNWKAYSETGGGVLNNYGVHVFDYLFHDCEDVEVVGARTGSLFPTRKDEQGITHPVSGDERAVVMLDAGYPVIVSLSLVTLPPIGHRVTVYGSKATMELANHSVTSPAGPFSIACTGQAGAPARQHLPSSAKQDDFTLVYLFRRTAMLFSQAIRCNVIACSPNISDGVKATRLIARTKDFALQR